MLAPRDDDAFDGYGHFPSRRRKWRNLGLRAAAFACAVLASLFAILAMGLRMLH